MSRRSLAMLCFASTALTFVTGALWTLAPVDAAAATGTAPGFGIAPAASDPTYQVTWVTRHAEQDLDGTLVPGASHTYSVQIDQANLTAVEFLLSWTDPGTPVPTSTDTYALAASDPAGTPLPASPVQADSNVLILRSRALAQVPADSVSYAPDPPSTDAQASSNGKGSWTVTVTLDPGSTGPDTAVTGTHAFILSILYEWYEANVLHPVQLVPRTLSSGFSPFDIWGVATYVLGGASAVLGTLLILDTRSRRNRRSHLAGGGHVLPRASLAPGAGNRAMEPASGRGEPPRGPACAPRIASPRVQGREEGPVGPALAAGRGRALFPTAQEPSPIAPGSPSAPREAASAESPRASSTAGPRPYRPPGR